MVQTVERLGCVDEKKEVLLLIVEFVIKDIGEFNDVILPPTPSDKNLLSWFDDGVNGGHDAVCYYCRNDAV